MTQVPSHCSGQVFDCRVSILEKNECRGNFKFSLTFSLTIGTLKPVLSTSAGSDRLRRCIQNRKWAVFSILCRRGGGCGAAATAQQPNKVPRIGFLTAGSPSTIGARIEALRQGLRELGYIEDKNIVIEWRFGQGKPDRLPDLVAELVRLKVDIIVSAGSAVTRPAKDATRTIPIVMTQDTDPVGNTFVASLARPGGNITGLSSYSAELNGKRLELLKETVSKLSRLAVIGESTYPGNTQSLKETELAAGALKVQLQYLDVLD